MTQQELSDLLWAGLLDPDEYSSLKDEVELPEPIGIAGTYLLDAIAAATCRGAETVVIAPSGTKMPISIRPPDGSPGVRAIVAAYIPGAVDGEGAEGKKDAAE